MGSQNSGLTCVRDELFLNPVHKIRTVCKPMDLLVERKQ